jgi:2-iminobutanoate/2-iminopropanoate deaminase
MIKKAISTTKAPAAVGPYSQAIATGKLLFISGQLPINPETGNLNEGSIEEKTRQVIENIHAIAESAGADLKHVVKTTVFLKDMSNFQAMNGIYAEYFEGTPPARSAVQVAALPLDADIEIETIICIPQG